MHLIARSILRLITDKIQWLRHQNRNETIWKFQPWLEGGRPIIRLSLQDSRRYRRSHRINFHTCPHGEDPRGTIRLLSRNDRSQRVSEDTRIYRYDQALCMDVDLDLTSLQRPIVIYAPSLVFFPRLYGNIKWGSGLVIA